MPGSRQEEVGGLFVTARKAATDGHAVARGARESMLNMPHYSAASVPFAIPRPEKSQNYGIILRPLSAWLRKTLQLVPEFAKLPGPQGGDYFPVALTLPIAI
ncbi:MAG: hypothetical protein EB141_19995 [Verrucomicrobia bacterium]|nr:hypothetical protein [Verrucomicrobiota bacterium]NBU09866.1 hypothetical protein [Pseudomonadota bacterium]NDA67286.1 hypothetical protein [Verrucomicrobiota bacterium]NDB77895.1 hypothetical protein [Verrucomicrobiota bacterium]NDD40712.1 hypothetical protein [Verrucomicrobiota bacterium]